jgi:pimeloyl-ACP methyl ester carboxylesterase
MECDLGDITIHYQQIGSGRPFLFMHGGIGDHQLWRLALEPVFEHHDGWKRIYIDLPGHGLTRAPDWLTNEDQFVEVLFRFTDRLIPNEVFAAGGFSWGGYWLAQILCKRPAALGGLLFVGSYPPGFDEKPPERKIVFKDDALVANLSGMEKELAANLLVVQNKTAIDGIRAMSQAFESFGRDDAAFGARFKYSEPQGLSAPCEKPTLFLLGRQDHLAGYRSAWQALESFPRATFAVLDLAGHGIGSMEQVQLSRALIHDWLDRVEESAKA